MKVLLITGKLAEEIVKKNSMGCDVFVVDIDVAAFITEKHLENLDLSKYDLVLVPGLAKGKWERIEREKGVKVRLGPVHAYDIPKVLEKIEEIELSHEIPADRLIEIDRISELIKLVDSKDFGVFDINGIQIGGESRMKIVAEIVDATELEKDSLISKIEDYKNKGADIIDLGIPISYDESDVRRVVKIAKDFCDAVSIDTFSPKAIRIGVEEGADMIMSLSEKNLKILDYIDDKAVVVVEKDIERLSWLIKLTKQKTEKIIADPVLEIHEISESLLRYKRFREEDPITPMLFGVGNITELFDADSHGINAVMSYIAEDIGANILFTTEASPKTFNSIRELRIGSYMSKGAKLKKTPPKDLGLNLLIIKEKIRYPEADIPKDCVEAKESGEFIRDPKGDFRIWLSKGKIVCNHEKACIIGEDAKSIIDNILSLDLVSRLDHAAYLGRELKKAEIALKLRKNYIQDRELNFGFYIK